MVLYLIVGMIAVFDVFVYMVYHRIASRPPPGRQHTKFKFFSYIKLTIYPALFGMGLALVPIVVGNIFIAIFIAGHFLSTSTAIYPCTDPGGLSVCPITLFDNILDFPGNANIDFVALRTGRTGVCMILMGAYILYVGLSILIPDKTSNVSLYFCIDYK